MPRNNFIRSTTFQWTLAIAVSFLVSYSVLFGFFYWQTADYMDSRIDSIITKEFQLIAQAAPMDLNGMIRQWPLGDPRRIKVVGLFDKAGDSLAGNIAARPEQLRVDGVPHNTIIERNDAPGLEKQRIRTVAGYLSNGNLLIVGRDSDELEEIGHLVLRALLLGIVPALVLATAIGILLSLRAQKGIEAVNRAAQRIVAGDLRERLSTRGSTDPFDRLALIINGMFDEIEKLVQELAGVGDDIAHELRTPLTRVRSRLERGRKNAQLVSEFQTVIDEGIADLDKCLSIITALLRIVEIEHSQRLSHFGDVDLVPIISEVMELYAPIAEDKNIAFALIAPSPAPARGDRDLLFEALANIVDNAIKFTAPGGRVDLHVLNDDDRTIIRIIDTGPGIPEAELALVSRRFYRSDRTQDNKGVGLGLNLVFAIIKLHAYYCTIKSGPGCIVEITAPYPK